jgi:glycerol-3-phosphate dehydrogenase
VVGALGESPARRRCVTRTLLLLGATARARDPVTRAQPSGHLLGRYGSEWPAVGTLSDERPELDDAVVEGLPYTGAEFVYAVREEMACTLDDLLSRRTRATIQQARACLRAAGTVAALVAPEMGWDPPAVHAEVDRYTASCRGELAAAGLDAS